MLLNGKNIPHLKVKIEFHELSPPSIQKTKVTSLHILISTLNISLMPVVLLIMSSILIAYYLSKKVVDRYQKKIQI